MGNAFTSMLDLAGTEFVRVQHGVGHVTEARKSINHDELLRVQLPDLYSVDWWHFPTLYALDSNRDGNFSYDDLLNFVMWLGATFDESTLERAAGHMPMLSRATSSGDPSKGARRAAAGMSFSDLVHLRCVARLFADCRWKAGRERTPAKVLVAKLERFLQTGVLEAGDPNDSPVASVVDWLLLFAQRGGEGGESNDYVAAPSAKKVTTRRKPGCPDPFDTDASTSDSDDDDFDEDDVDGDLDDETADEMVSVLPGSPKSPPALPPPFYGRHCMGRLYRVLGIGTSCGITEGAFYVMLLALPPSAQGGAAMTSGIDVSPSSSSAGAAPFDMGSTSQTSGRWWPSDGTNGVNSGNSVPGYGRIGIPPLLTQDHSRQTSQVFSGSGTSLRMNSARKRSSARSPASLPSYVRVGSTAFESPLYTHRDQQREQQRLSSRLTEDPAGRQRAMIPVRRASRTTASDVSDTCSLDESTDPTPIGTYALSSPAPAPPVPEPAPARVKDAAASAPLGVSEVVLRLFLTAFVESYLEALQQLDVFKEVTVAPQPATTAPAPS